MKPVYLRALVCVFSLITVAMAALPVVAQEGPLDSSAPKGITPEEIITRFAAREKLFKEAREHYTYRQDIKVQTRDGNTVTGEYHEVFDVLYDDKGHRIENVVFAPQSSLEQGGLSLDEGDVQDFRNRLPFVLTSDEIAEYNILYVGQQQEDQLHCYVFDIAPKQIVGKKRYFQGRIWVDDHDMQIVKTYGQAVPEIKDTKKKGKEEHLYPEVHHMAGADRQPVLVPHLHARRRYPALQRWRHSHSRDREVRGLQRFGSNVRILYNGQEVPKAEQKDQKAPPGSESEPRSEEAGSSTESATAAEIASANTRSLVSLG